MCLQVFILSDREPYVYNFDISLIMELASCGSTFRATHFSPAIFQKVNVD